MAYVKLCDNCNTHLDRAKDPYLQIHGSISEQQETPNGEPRYRYLSLHPEFRGAWCNAKCLLEWFDKRRKEQGYIQRLPRDSVVHISGVD